MSRPQGIEIETDQSSPEFFLLRRGPKGLDIGSSDAGVAIGTCEFAYPRDLWRHIKKRPGYEGTAEDNPACAHGRRCEAIIADRYAEITGYELRPGNSFKAPGQGSSPDRKVYEDGRWVGILEVKAPYGPMYLTGKLKRDHLVQVQHQMELTGKDWCDYVYGKLPQDPDEPYDDFPITIIRFYHSEEFCSRFLRPRLGLMIQWLEEDEEPPLNPWKESPKFRCIKRTILHSTQEGVKPAGAKRPRLK